MLCRSTRAIRSKGHCYISLLTGIFLMAFSIIGVFSDMVESNNIAMLLGMFTGVGAVFIAVGALRLLRMRFSSAEKLKEEEIDLKDERNIQVMRAAHAISNTMTAIMLGLMAFIFVYLDYIVPALVVVGALCVQMIVFLISYQKLNKKM